MRLLAIAPPSPPCFCFLPSAGKTCWHVLEIHTGMFRKYIPVCFGKHTGIYRQYILVCFTNTYLYVFSPRFSSAAGPQPADREEAKHFPQHSSLRGEKSSAPASPRKLRRFPYSMQKICQRLFYIKPLAPQRRILLFIYFVVANENYSLFRPTEYFLPNQMEQVGIFYSAARFRKNMLKTRKGGAALITAPKDFAA